MTISQPHPIKPELIRATDNPTRRPPNLEELMRLSRSVQDLETEEHPWAHPDLRRIALRLERETNVRINLRCDRRTQLVTVEVEPRAPTYAFTIPDAAMTLTDERSIEAAVATAAAAALADLVTSA